MKYTGLAGRATEVNSISYKTVDSAAFLDSIDAINYPVRSPYGLLQCNRSYENWIKFKLRISRHHRLDVDGNIFSCHDNELSGEFTTITNLKLWLTFSCGTGYDIKYNFTRTYTPPVISESIIATNNIRQLQSRQFNDKFSVQIPFGDVSEMQIGNIDLYCSDFFVSQLTAYKGCQFQNNLIGINLSYDLK